MDDDSVVTSDSWSDAGSANSMMRMRMSNQLGRPGGGGRTPQNWEDVEMFRPNTPPAQFPPPPAGPPPNGMQPARSEVGTDTEGLEGEQLGVELFNLESEEQRLRAKWVVEQLEAWEASDRRSLPGPFLGFRWMEGFRGEWLGIPVAVVRTMQQQRIQRPEIAVDLVNPRERRLAWESIGEFAMMQSRALAESERAMAKLKAQISLDILEEFWSAEQDQALYEQQRAQVESIFTDLVPRERLQMAQEEYDAKYNECYWEFDTIVRSKDERIAELQERNQELKEQIQQDRKSWGKKVDERDLEIQQLNASLAMEKARSIHWEKEFIEEQHRHQRAVATSRGRQQALGVQLQAVQAELNEVKGTTMQVG